MSQLMVIILIVITILALFFIVVMLIDGNRFKTVEYQLFSNKINKEHRYVVLSDLHNKEYGKENKKLLQKIHELEPEAVLIAGESGAGKSTVTTAFLEKGYHLMADDMAFVEVGKDKKAMAKPAFPYQKLCRNVASEKGHALDYLIYINEEKDKFLVPYEGEFFLGAVPIKAFVMLGVNDTEEVVAKEMTGFNRVPVYTNNLFLRHLLKRDKYNPAIAQKCVEMAAAVPTFYVARPKEGDTVSEVVKKVFEFVENGGDANVWFFKK